MTGLTLQGDGIYMPVQAIWWSYFLSLHGDGVAMPVQGKNILCMYTSTVMV